MNRRLLLAVVAGMVTLTVAVVAATSFSGSEPTVARTSSNSAPFDQHYRALDQRRQAAHVPTMMETMTSSVHFHPLLKVFIAGKQISIPANIGIDPGVDGMKMAGLHTHDPSGTVHVEGMPGARLGQFFAIWGVPLSPRQLGPYRAAGQRQVRMWVDGKPSKAFGRLTLQNGQRITVSVGTSPKPPG